VKIGLTTLGTSDSGSAFLNEYGRIFPGEMGSMMKRTRGVTLVELLLVVVVLCFLAVGLVPQFSQAGDEPKTSTLCKHLQSVRAQIDLYQVQHFDRLPGCTEGVGFEQAMTKKTDVEGNVADDGNCGPYMEEIPENPFNESSSVRMDGKPAGVNTHGWRYDTETGSFQADSSKGHALL
jgi:type II secretory pathway pseudopilin PulG